MKPTYKNTFLALSLATATPAAFLFAQEDGEEDENVFTLSPFQVDGSADEGYRGASTTAGSRLNTELKNVSASVTVLTDAFMDDLGATDLTSALELVAGAETNELSEQTSETVAAFGQYTGGDFGDPTASEASVRVRGLGRAAKTQGFHEVFIGGDRYNVERAEFLRGPNSILFGLGTPAGLINYTAKKAHTNKEINKLDIVLDNFGTWRTGFDFNRSLIENKLGFRIAAKFGDQKYDVQHARERDNRVYSTFQYKPSKNTTINLAYEEIDRFSRKPTYRLVHDNVSGWLPLYNDFYSDQVANGLSGDALEEALLDAGFWWDPTDPANTNAASVRAVSGIIDPTYDIDGVGHGRPAGQVRLGDDLDGKDNALIIYHDGAFPDQELHGGINLSGTRTPTGSRGPASDRRTLIRTSHPLENRTNGFLDPQVTDPGIFPYHEFDLGSLPGNYRDEENSKLSFNIDQKINDNFYVSFSGLKEDYRIENNFPIISQTRAIQLDNNRYMLYLDENGDRVPNPNFMRPFIYGRPLGLYREQASESYQLQANYDFDFAEKFDRLSWLGKHRITGVANYRWSENFEYRWETRAHNYIPDVMASGVRADQEDAFNDGGRRIYNIWYVGDAVQPGDTSLNINAVPSNILTEEEDLYYNYMTSTPNVIATSPVPVELRRNSIGRGNWREQINKGLSGSIQSFFLNGRVVTLLGAREDSVYPYLRTRQSGDAFNQSVGRIDPDESTGERELFANDIERSYYNARPDANNPLIDVASVSKSVIVHVIPDKLRIFANQSENFEVSNPRSDNFGRVIPPQGGETEEFGIGANLLEGKMDLRLSFYETSQVNANGPNWLPSQAIPGIENRIYNALEDAGRLSEWWTYDVNGQVTTNQYVRPDNVNDTQDSTSEGFEFTGTYNPTKNLRLLFSVSRLENQVTNVSPRVEDWLSDRMAFYGPFFAEGLNNDGTNNPDIFERDGNGNLTNELADETIARWFVDSVVGRYASDLAREGRPNLGVSEYTGKFVADYSFREGRLKGFSVGANVIFEDGKVIGSNRKEIPVTDLVPEFSDVPGFNDPNNVVNASIGDPDNPLFGDSVLTAGVKFGYRTKIMNDSVDWRIQLNASRLVDTSNEGGFRVTGLNPDAVDSNGNALDSNRYRLSVPTTWRLTSTFSW
ncbi:TonB-dependent receptor plug domain-containing protein [Pelagicoccus enzymogenes]|uniref:TonB-dependent receptor plug domain-containing protein n=1 Tax=Pelagicoccus enzymogenes TaxID=2773457 RepID=UPI00280FEF42|nr:TonB-dependent receptor plug domain-containing protein [Pelagicoccus enzymogenes]MDQ8198589.1 TonB-dependent receptor plug domain-containing protein [Pelagicoccus enzymogenes]